MHNLCSLSRVLYWPRSGAPVSLSWEYCPQAKQELPVHWGHVYLKPGVQRSNPFPQSAANCAANYFLFSEWDQFKAFLQLRLNFWLVYLSHQVLLSFPSSWEHFPVELLAQEFTPQALLLWNLTQDTTLECELPEVRQCVSSMHC